MNIKVADVSFSLQAIKKISGNLDNKDIKKLVEENCISYNKIKRDEQTVFLVGFKDIIICHAYNEMKERWDGYEDYIYQLINLRDYLDQLPWSLYKEDIFYFHPDFTHFSTTIILSTIEESNLLIEIPARLPATLYEISMWEYDLNIIEKEMEEFEEKEDEEEVDPEFKKERESFFETKVEKFEREIETLKKSIGEDFYNYLLEVFREEKNENESAITDFDRTSASIIDREIDIRDDHPLIDHIFSLKKDDLLNILNVGEKDFDYMLKRKLFRIKKNKKDTFYLISESLLCWCFAFCTLKKQMKKTEDAMQKTMQLKTYLENNGLCLGLGCLFVLRGELFITNGELFNFTKQIKNSNGRSFFSKKNSLTYLEKKNDCISLDKQPVEICFK